MERSLWVSYLFNNCFLHSFIVSIWNNKNNTKDVFSSVSENNEVRFPAHWDVCPNRIRKEERLCFHSGSLVFPLYSPVISYFVFLLFVTVMDGIFMERQALNRYHSRVWNCTSHSIHCYLYIIFKLFTYRYQYFKRNVLVYIVLLLVTVTQGNSCCCRWEKQAWWPPLRTGHNMGRRFTSLL